MIDISYDEEDRCSQILYLALCLNIELTSYLMPVWRAPDLYGLMLRGSGLLQKPALLGPMFRPSQDPMRWLHPSSLSGAGMRNDFLVHQLDQSLSQGR
jgi:hypothetical protein